MKTRIDLFCPLLLLILLAACSNPRITRLAPTEHIKAQMEKLAPVELFVDLTRLPADEAQVVRLLVQAAQIMDELFLEQVWEGNPRLLSALEKKQGEQEVYAEFYRIMFGPWDRLNEDEPFVNELPKPPGAGFYPPDMTKEAFHSWLEAHPEDQEAFEGNFTVIQKKNETLKAVPYSEHYGSKLKKAARILRRAADLTSDESLKTFLRSRAEAFLSNDYYQSDMDWMDLNGDIEVVIGPYEVYEDKLFGYKAAFESFVCIVDHEESEKLSDIAGYLDAMEQNLPVPDKYKNFNRGSSSPIKVVNEVFTGGDTKAGIQTTAFNLPNDERVREAKGSKKVMLKNVMNAKFEKCWIPIVNEVLAPQALNRVSFEGYFNHVLMHEISHALGPGNIQKNGQETTVNRELKELYSTIEECKADVLGMLNAQFLIDKGVFPRELEKTLYASNLGGMFRSIRFGIGEAHGGGVAIQLNYYLEKGAFTVDKDGRFDVNDRRMKRAVIDLSRELLLIQARGDYQAAKRLMDKYRVLDPRVEEALNRLTNVPIDIRPVYPIIDTLR